uniref:BZIP domain-containing protein n=1 Tax=Aureoumbra lagunensis TaxID=44058 RepID=A0A7S3K1Z1_9STRA
MSTRDGCDILLEVAEKASLAMTANSEPPNYTMHPPNASNYRGELQDQGPTTLAPSTSESFLPVSSPYSFSTEVGRTTGLGVPSSYLPVSSHGVYSMGMRNDTTSQARSIDRINEDDSYVPSYIPSVPSTSINMAPARDLLTSSRTTNGNANSTINETQENYNDAADDDGLYSDEAREAMIRDRIRRERNREYARQSRARKRKEIEALHEFESTLRESLTKAERQVCTLQEGYAKVQQELEETRQACSLLEQEHAKLRERITRSEYDNSRLNAWIDKHIIQNGYLLPSAPPPPSSFI